MTTCDIKLASVVNQAMLHVNSITYIIVIKTKTLTDHGNHPSVPCRNIHADSVHSVVLQCGPRTTNTCPAVTKLSTVGVHTVTMALTWLA